MDANSKFITVDMGGFGKQSDWGTFLASDLFSFIDGKRISFPEPDLLPHRIVTDRYRMLVGCLDGKYTHIVCPTDSGEISNYKR